MTSVKARQPPLFDTGKTPPDASRAGQQPAVDLWGVGKKTADRLHEKLSRDPTATPTVADFAYASLDTFDSGPAQRALLAEQQQRLVNEFGIRPEDAATPVASSLLDRLEERVTDALKAIAAGEQPEGLVHHQMVGFARDIGMSYGIYGSVGVPTPDEMTKAHAAGMAALEPGEVALAVRSVGSGERQAGVVVVPVRPRDLLAPAVYTRSSDGSQEHTFMAARNVRRVRAFVVEEPADPFNKLKFLETQALDAAAAVWSDADPAGRRARLQTFTAKLEAFAAAVAEASLGTHQASRVHGSLNALRSILDVTEQNIDA